MKYYGNANKKLGMKIAEIMENDLYNPGTPIGFINKNGDLAEYFENLIEVNGIDDDELYEVDTDPANVTMHKIEYNGKTYWWGTNCYDVRMSLRMGRRVGVYVQNPDIYDDKVFHWKNNKKYGTMECTIEEGVFEYQCIYKPDGNANINVRYTACDNAHRNKVTMSTIEVMYADNDTIIDAIKAWKKQFKGMFVA